MHNFLEKQLPGCVAWGLGRPRGRAATPSHLPPDQAATPSSPDVSSSHGAPSRSAASATSHRWPWHPTASCIFGARFLCILFFHFLCLLSHQCKQALAAIQTRRWPLSFLQLRQVRSQQEHLGWPNWAARPKCLFHFFPHSAHFWIYADLLENFYIRSTKTAKKLRRGYMGNFEGCYHSYFSQAETFLWCWETLSGYTSVADTYCNIHAPTLAFEYFIIVFVLQAAGDLCLHKLGANLYERIKKECEIHIAEKISALVGQSPDLVVFLSLVQKEHGKIFVIRCWLFVVLLYFLM